MSLSKFDIKDCVRHIQARLGDTVIMSSRCAPKIMFRYDDKLIFSFSKDLILKITSPEHQTECDAMEYLLFHIDDDGSSIHGIPFHGLLWTYHSFTPQYQWALMPRLHTTLRIYMSEKQNCTPAFIDRATQRLTTTVFAMHEIHICHRDMHTDNIMVDAGGNVMVIDFDRAYIHPHTGGDALLFKLSKRKDWSFTLHAVMFMEHAYQSHHLPMTAHPTHPRMPTENEDVQFIAVRDKSRANVYKVIKKLLGKTEEASLPQDVVHEYDLGFYDPRVFYWWSKFIRSPK